MDDVRAIERVLAEYCQRCDDGRFGELAELFTEDGTFAFGSTEATGRTALVAYYETAQSPDKRGKHIAANVVVDVDGETATAHSDWVFLVVRRNGAVVPLAAGRYTDDLRKVGGAWRIARRAATTI